MQGRGKFGRFKSKSDSDRKVRSIRATDETWDKFGELATERSITRADLLEEATRSATGTSPNNLSQNSVIHGAIEEAIQKLVHGTTSKKQGGAYAANSAKGLKDEVVDAIALLKTLTE